MSLVGFSCPRLHQDISFEECISDCPDRCMELPILLAMTEDIREPRLNTYSTTEILNPPKQIYLMRENDYYVRPMDMTWMLFGTAFHGIVEDQKGNLPLDYSVEHANSFKVTIVTPVGTAYLTGRPDQYQESTKTLTDYKTLKYYWDLYYIWEKNDWESSKYKWQLNIYRHYKFPQATKMQLYALIKDYDKRLKEKGIPPMVRVEVPMVKGELVGEFVRGKFETILRNQKDPRTIEGCTESDRWKGDIRCLNYCSVNKFCDYWQDNYRGNQEINAVA